MQLIYSPRTVNMAITSVTKVLFFKQLISIYLSSIISYTSPKGGRQPRNVGEACLYNVAFPLFIYLKARSSNLPYSLLNIIKKSKRYL